ncbi:hypothetical protein [Pedobacter antarcticus]|uniref:hypothetical protein n=1 Tax=Pedobacter antarcticus TaxID=34086 RepID=UPI00292EDB22|nr:hypothetical protein [Pedobacter antarcticus]
MSGKNVPKLFYSGQLQRYALLMLTIVSGMLFFGGYRYFFKAENIQPSLPPAYRVYPNIRDSATQPGSAVSILLDLKTDNATLSAPLYFPEQQITLITAKYLEGTAGNATSYYKLDHSGQLTDSLHYRNNKNKLIMTNGFLLHPDFFYSWVLDGSRTRNTYKEWNKNLSWSAERIKAEMAAILEKADAIYVYSASSMWPSDSDLYNGKVDKLIYVVKGKGHALYGAGLIGVRPAGTKPYQEMPDQIELARNHDTQANATLDFNSKDYLLVENNTLKTWRGKAFLSLKKGQHLLKIKQNVFIDEQADGSQSISAMDLGYYTAEKSAFSLIREGRFSYYIFKP